MQTQTVSSPRVIVSLLPPIEFMDVFSASRRHIHLRVKFEHEPQFPRLLETMQISMEKGKVNRDCKIVQVYKNGLGHWDFHLEPIKGSFPFGRLSIFHRRDKFKDKSITIQILYGNEWQDFQAALY